MALIESDAIKRAKQTLGDKMAEMIVEELEIEDFDFVNMKCCCPFHKEDTPSFIWNKKALSFRCFRGDTKVITRDGVFPIKDLVGKQVQIINGNGEWEQVEFRNYGKQQIWEVHLRRFNSRKVIYATKEHEWIVRRVKEKIETSSLQSGQTLESQWYRFNPDDLEPDRIGMIHGFMYGDGSKLSTCQNGENYYHAVVWNKNKLDFCKTIFDRIDPPAPSQLSTDFQSALGNVYFKTTDNFKSVPDIRTNINYLFGFLIGYFVTDGNCSDDTALFSSTKYDDLCKIKDICTALGIPTYAISSTTRTPESNMGLVKLKRPSTIYTLRMVKSCVPEKLQFGTKKLRTKSPVSNVLGYKVDYVVPTSDIEDVYCTTTSTHSFVLEDFILTGNCFGSCGRSYDLIDVLMTKGDTYVEAVQKMFKAADMPYAFGEHHVKTQRDYRYPKEVECTDKTRVYAYAERRKISKETIDKLDIREDERGNCVFNYYDANDVLTMVKYRPSHPVRHGELKNWCQKDADTTPLLFNMNRINPAQPLLITSGEFDCVSAVEAGWSNAVSIPLGDGNTHWVEECWDWLEQFDSIIICPDTDQSGQKYAKEIVPRLGSWRTKVVELPLTYTTVDGTQHGIKDLNELLFWAGKEAVIDVILHAKDSPVPSVSDISDVEDFDLTQMDGVRIGLKPLDDELSKLFYGTLTILSGMPGSGKSSLIAQMMCNAMDDGQNVFLFSGELANAFAKSWNMFVLAGEHHIKTVETEGGDTFYRVAPDARDAINKHYAGRWFIYKDDQSTDIDSLLRTMEDVVRKYGARFLILDNMMCLDLNATHDDELRLQTETIKKLIAFTKKYMVATLLVAHPRKLQDTTRVGLYDLAGTSNIANLAHRTLAMKRITDDDRENMQYFSKRRQALMGHDVLVSILKDRMRGRSSKEVGLYYDAMTRRFYSNDTEFYHQYAWDRAVRQPMRPYPPDMADADVFGYIKSE